MSRPQRVAEALHIRFAEFELDEANAMLRRRGVALALAPTPFALLCALARHPGALLTKEALLDAVWGHRFVTESVLKTAISDLRTALDDSPRSPRIVETVARRGYRFVAATAAAALAPPDVAGRGPRGASSFVGRADAVARLQRAWSMARDGQRALVWVGGEPGIGKTTLIEHFVEGLDGVARARGQCVEHDGSAEPYLPVLDALAALCRDDPGLPALLRGVAPTWLLQLPWLGTAEERESLRRELAGVGSDRMLREMGELLDRYTEHRPLVLVTEDLHWSDRSTLQLIDHVARRRGRSCLMWLASFRVAEVVARDHPLNPLRRELRLHRLCDEVVLDPFSESEVSAYVAQRSASLARDEAFVRTLHERTDGVPLFVSSVVTDIMDATGDDAAVASRLAAVGVPDNLASLVEHHIAKLDSAQHALLAAAAVGGVEFRSDIVATVLGRDAATVALACDELVRGQVWLVASRADVGGDAPEGLYAFRHAMFRQVLVDRMPPALRVQRHREVGAALEQLRDAGAAVAASVLATHFDRGRQPLAALRYYAEAGEIALRDVNPAACLGLAERAMELLKLAPQGVERDALEVSVATLGGIASLHLRGFGADTEGALGRAYALLADAPAHPMRGRLLHALGFVLSLRGDYARALEVAQRAEALGAVAHDPTLTLVACLLRGEVHHLAGPTREARAWIDRGLAVAQAADIGPNEVFAADPQATLLGMQAIEFVHRGLHAQARAHVRRASERARELRQPMTRLVADWYQALLEVRLGNAADLAALAGGMQRLVEEFSLEQGRTACRWFLGLAQARQGRAREGYRLIRDAFEESRQLGMRAGASEVLGYATEALLAAGDHEAARAQLREAFAAADEIGEDVYRLQLWLLGAAIDRAQGRRAAGEVSAQRVIEQARAQESPWIELLARIELAAQRALDASERRDLDALVRGLPEAEDAPAFAQARRLLAAAG